MRGLAGDRAICELLLYVYFSKHRDRLTDKDKELLGEFIDLCKAKDKLDNTQVADTVIKLYSAGVGLTVKETEDLIGLSGASLYRFRAKIADRLSNFLKDAQQSIG